MSKTRNISEDARLKKNTSIKETRQKTREKRGSQDCLVFEFKLSKHKMTKKQLGSLSFMFVQGKWMKNFLIAESKKENSEIDIFKYEFKNTVVHKDKDMNDVTSELTLGSQIKQSVVQSIRQEISNLSKAKKAGQNIGKLKFVTDYKSIDLKQYNITYKIFQKSNHNFGKLKIQGIKRLFTIYGLDQLETLEKQGLEYEFANAKLIKDSCGDFFLKVTVYVDKAKHQEIKMKSIKRELDGFDMGCSDSETRSDGCVANFRVQEPESLVFHQHELEKHRKNSRRYKAHQLQIRKNYRHMTNKKAESANKIVHQMLEAETVVIQDEQIASWQEDGHGKAVTHSCLGRIKRKLEQEAKTTGRVVILNKWLPTTKLCTKCGKLLDLSLADREFICECGCHDARDTHAAQNMLWFYRHHIGVGKDNDIEYNELMKLISAAVAADNADSEQDITSGKSGTDSTINKARKELQSSEREAPNALASE